MAYTQPCNAAILTGEVGHNFRDEIVAQAKALALTGYSTRRAAVELQVLFPGEDTPAHPTLVEWRKELSEADHEKLGDNERRIALRVDELVEAKLETFEDKLDKVRLPELVMAAGVYRDKLFKRQDQKQPVSSGDITINFISQAPPNPEPDDVVEGEIIREGDGPSS